MFWLILLAIVSAAIGAAQLFLVLVNVDESKKRVRLAFVACILLPYVTLNLLATELYKNEGSLEYWHRDPNEGVWVWIEFDTDTVVTNPRKEKLGPKDIEPLEKKDIEDAGKKSP